MTTGMLEATARGVVVAGHGVASGRCPDPRFPAGTIALQLPVFLRRGVDVARLLGAEPLLGTINVDVSPATVRVVVPQILLADVAWCAAVPAETFWLFHAGLDHAGVRHPALIYMPDPATKPGHFQPAGVVEVIAARVPGLAVGDAVGLTTDRDHLGFGHSA